MSTISVFFDTIEGYFKTIEKDAKSVITKLFGPKGLAELEASADAVLASDFGKAVLEDAKVLQAQVKTGAISEHSAIVSLVQYTLAAGKKTGIALESSIASAVAALAMARLSGVLGTDADSDTRTEAQKIVDIASYAEMEKANKQRLEQEASKSSLPAQQIEPEKPAPAKAPDAPAVPKPAPAKPKA